MRIAAALLLALLAATAVNGISLRHVQRKENLPKPVYETPEIIDKDSDDNNNNDNENNDSVNEDGEVSDESGMDSPDEEEDATAPEDASLLEGDDKSYVQPEIVDKGKLHRGSDDGDDDGDDDGTEEVPEDDGDDDSFLQEAEGDTDDDLTSLLELLDSLEGDDDDDSDEDHEADHESDARSYVVPEIVDKASLKNNDAATGFVQIQARTRGDDGKYIMPEIISPQPRFLEIRRSDGDTYITPEIRDPSPPRFKEVLRVTESSESVSESVAPAPTSESASPLSAEGSQSDSPEEKALSEAVAAAAAAEESSSATTESSEIPAAPLVPGSQSSGCQTGQCGVTFVQPSESDCGSDCGNSGGSGISVDDAVRGVDDWLDDFKKRTGENIDVYTAADDAARPLVESLKVQQDDAIEKLEETNEEIRDHVKERVAEHMVNILNNQDAADAKEEQAEVQRTQAEAAEDAVAQAEEKAEEAENDLENAEQEVHKSEGSKHHHHHRRHHGHGKGKKKGGKN